MEHRVDNDRGNWLPQLGEWNWHFASILATFPLEPTKSWGCKNQELGARDFMGYDRGVANNLMSGSVSSCVYTLNIVDFNGFWGSWLLERPMWVNWKILEWLSQKKRNAGSPVGWLCCWCYFFWAENPRPWPRRSWPSVSTLEADQRLPELRTKGPIANTLLKIIDFGLSKCFDEGAPWMFCQKMSQQIISTECSCTATGMKRTQRDDSHWLFSWSYIMFLIPALPQNSH